MRISLLATLSVLSLSIAVPAYALSPVACTEEAKICPDGVTYVGRDGMRNCQWQLCPGEKDVCAPYMCKDGTQIARCAEDGTVINYFAAPCLTHGGEIDSSQSFSDVPATHPNAEAIAYVKAQGIVEGYADGTYRPDATINRAEFTKILMSAFSMGSTDFARCDEDEIFKRQVQYFTDVGSGQWYSRYVCRGKDASFISGYSDGSFRPSASINFVEAAKIISKTFGTFDTTESQTSLWYEAYVRDLGNVAAIPLSMTRFDQLVTRGEMAEMIWRLKTGTTNKPSSTYDVLEVNMGTETHGSISTFHHNNPAFSFQFPAGWTISDDRGDLIVYIDHTDTGKHIDLNYCESECSGPLHKCDEPYTRKVVPLLNVEGCLFVNEFGSEHWSKIGVPVSGTYYFSVDGTKDELKKIWPILKSIRSSLRIR